MKRLLIACTIFSILLFGYSSTVFSLTLEFAPNAQTVALGDQAIVDVIISDLSDEFIGAYDFNVLWDSSLLSLYSVTFGPYLDGPLYSLQSYDDSIPGEVNVAELSYDLLLNQDGVTSFPLFSLAFDTHGIGTSPLSFSNVVISDEWGFPIYPIELSGEISIVSNNQIPEPATMILFGVGLLSIAGLGRKKK